MSLISPSQLAAAVSIPIDRAQDWSVFIEHAMAQFDVVSPRRKAAFIAQTALESLFFTRTVENLNYSRAERIVAVFGSRFKVPEHVDRTAYRVQLAQAYVRNPVGLGNFVYANLNGNGPVESGDGYRFRGRGLIMCTGRSMYQHVGDGLGLDLINKPELLEERGMAAMSAGFYWAGESLNEWADRGDIDAISGIINRGDPLKIALHEAERRTLYRDCLEVFDV
jgi:putative chitinase